eukprot:SAG31_NODE_691_length_12779_cov_19.035095_7_plen_112_part_00
MNDRSEPDVPNDHRARGNEAFNAGLFQEAVGFYTEALAADKNNHELLSNRSGAHYQKGDFKAALGDARTCVSLEPSYAKGYSRLGHALLKLDRYTESVEAFNKGLSLDPRV